MKLGFIGTGKIASSVITGICGSSIKYSKISISSRKTKIILYYFFGILFLIFSFLSLEYIIPLLVLTIFLPILIELSNINKLSRKIVIKLFLLYFLPVVLVAFSYLIFKALIVPLYGIYGGGNIYGFSAIRPESFLQAIYYFLVILIELPLLIIEVIPHLLQLKLAIIFLLTFPL